MPLTNLYRCFLIVAGFGAVSFLSACDFFRPSLNYKVYAANYGTTGVEILKMSYVPEQSTASIQIDPDLPSKYDRKRRIGKFSGYDVLLPKEVVVTWALARLSNCKKEYKSDNYPGHVRKYGCTWTPIEGQVFSQELDMETIRNSEAYQRTGDYVEGNPLAGTVTLRIVLIFNEGTLRVEARNGKTMGFMQ